MGAVELIYLLLPLAAGILATAGYAVMTFTPPDYAVARRCFWSAGALVVAVIVIWGATTVLDNKLLRFAVIGFGASVVAIATVEAVRWVNKRESTAPAAISTDKPKIAIKLVYKSAPAIVIENRSDALANNIKISVALWNTRLEDRNDPLPIPIEAFDWIKPRDSSGPIGVFKRPEVAALLTDGDVLMGAIAIDCANCDKGETSIVKIVWGRDGWHFVLDESLSGKLVVPENFSKPFRLAYFQKIEQTATAEGRIAISAKLNN